VLGHKPRTAVYLLCDKIGVGGERENIKTVDGERERQRELSTAYHSTASLPERHCRLASRKKNAGSGEKAVLQSDLTRHSRVDAANISRLPSMESDSTTGVDPDTRASSAAA